MNRNDRVITIIRAGEKNPMRSLFSEIKKGDTFFIKGQPCICEIDAHESGDASYDGYLLYDTDGDSWFPEDLCEEIAAQFDYVDLMTQTRMLMQKEECRQLDWKNMNWLRGCITDLIARKEILHGVAQGVNFMAATNDGSSNVQVKELLTNGIASADANFATIYLSSAFAKQFVAVRAATREDACTASFSGHINRVCYALETLFDRVVLLKALTTAAINYNMQGKDDSEQPEAIVFIRLRRILAAETSQRTW